MAMDITLNVTLILYEAKVQVECCFHWFLFALWLTLVRLKLTKEKWSLVRAQCGWVLLILYVNRFHEAKTKDVRRKGRAQLRAAQLPFVCLTQLFRSCVTHPSIMTRNLRRASRTPQTPFDNASQVYEVEAIEAKRRKGGTGVGQTTPSYEWANSWRNDLGSFLHQKET